MKSSIIKSDTEYKNALKRLDEIFQPKNSIEQVEFDLLVMFINKYEDENYHIDEVDPIQVIKSKMKYLSLKQKDMVKYLNLLQTQQLEESVIC